MRNRFLLAVCCIAAVGAATVWGLRPGTPRTADSGSPSRLSVQIAPTTNGSAREPAVASAPSTNNEVPELATQTSAPNATTAATNPKNPFRVDSTGKLVVDAQTRLNIEALFAQTDPAGLLEAQQEVTQKLPPAAAAEAAALVERYGNYSKAQRHAYPPGVAPATEEAALAELDGLHALRVAHFGPEVAQAFYGAEEAITRSLIELMRLEKDQGLTMEEKAARAQRLYDAMPAPSGQR